MNDIVSISILAAAVPLALAFAIYCAFKGHGKLGYLAGLVLVSAFVVLAYRLKYPPGRDLESNFLGFIFGWVGMVVVYSFLCFIATAGREFLTLRAVNSVSVAAGLIIAALFLSQLAVVGVCPGRDATCVGLIDFLTYLSLCDMALLAPLLVIWSLGWPQILARVWRDRPGLISVSAIVSLIVGIIVFGPLAFVMAFVWLVLGLS